VERNDFEGCSAPIFRANVIRKTAHLNYIGRVRRNMKIQNRKSEERKLKYKNKQKIRLHLDISATMEIALL
jgi:hypothetical protein